MRVRPARRHAIPTPTSAARTRSPSRACSRRPSSSHGTLLSSSFPALNDPAVAVDIYRGDTGLDTGRPQSLFSLDPRLIEQKRLTKEARVNLRAGRARPGSTTAPWSASTARVPFVNVQVSHDPGAGLGAGVRADDDGRSAGVAGGAPAPGLGSADTRRSRGTVSVELGGLARTDNSGWGDEFERSACPAARRRIRPTEQIQEGDECRSTRQSPSYSDLCVRVRVRGVRRGAFVLLIWQYCEREGRQGVRARAAGDRVVGRGRRHRCRRRSRRRRCPAGRRGAAQAVRGAARATRPIAVLIVGVALQVLLDRAARRRDQRWPLGNMYEFITITCAGGMVTGAGAVARQTYRALWVFVLFPVVVLLFLGGTVLYTQAAPVMPALQSYWLSCTSRRSASAGLFLVVPGIASILFLLRSAAARARSRGAGRAAAKVPGAQSLDRLAYRITIIAFPLYDVRRHRRRDLGGGGVGPVLGLGPEGDGLVHRLGDLRGLPARARDRGVADTQAAWVNVAGFAAMVFNLFFINLVVAGLHSYAGLS